VLSIEGEKTPASVRAAVHRVVPCHLGAPRGQGDESGNLSQVLTHARRPVRYYLFGPGGCL
jgi:hypothetical protein